MDITFIFLLICLAIIAFLYSSVGHGGASGYLAIMAIAGMAPAFMKSSALFMNLAVSVISFYGFYRAGHFRWSLFWPFAMSSIPLAFLGGNLTLSDSLYKKILGVCLLISIARMITQFKENNSEFKKISLTIALASGAIIGLISGMIGIGGGILLSPLMLLMNWSSIKQTAAVSSLFIFVNSIAGLLGQLAKGNMYIDEKLSYAVVATILGGIIGSYYGSQKFKSSTLKYFLAVGLMIASIKLICT